MALLALQGETTYRQFFEKRIERGIDSRDIDLQSNDEAFRLHVRSTDGDGDKDVRIEYDRDEGRGGIYVTESESDRGGGGGGGERRGGIYSSDRGEETRLEFSTEGESLGVYVLSLLLVVSWFAVNFYVQAALGVKRLRDLSWPIWLVVLTFIPYVGLGMFLLLGIVPGDARKDDADVLRRRDAEPMD